jgi:hypothetical protein
MSWPPTIGGTLSTFTTVQIDAIIAALSVWGGVTNASGNQIANLGSTFTSGVTATAVAVGIISPALTGGATITTAIGLQIAGQKITGVGTGYGIYQAGAADLNYFAGLVTFNSMITLASGASMATSGTLGGFTRPIDIQSHFPAIGPAFNIAIGITPSEVQAAGYVYAAAYIALGLSGSFAEPNYYPIDIAAPVLSGGATVTGGAAVRIEAQNISGVSGVFAILQAGTADINYFAGKVQTPNLGAYASDAAAGSAGLTAGMQYRDSSGGMHVKL